MVPKFPPAAAIWFGYLFVSCDADAEKMSWSPYVLSFKKFSPNSLAFVYVFS